MDPVPQNFASLVRAEEIIQREQRMIMNGWLAIRAYHLGCNAARKAHWPRPAATWGRRMFFYHALDAQSAVEVVAEDATR